MSAESKKALKCCETWESVWHRRGMLTDALHLLLPLFMRPEGVSGKRFYRFGECRVDNQRLGRSHEDTLLAGGNKARGRSWPATLCALQFRMPDRIYELLTAFCLSPMKAQQAGALARFMESFLAAEMFDLAQVSSLRNQSQ
ncbi:hypothetical protein CCYA_CCYA01G0333 [Cyanidiococcus yangmingshanensis]|nr:hypothetical protein CCYA_CCYA01G0333 [Cyanidiococcus yangmingshanensis]